MNTELDDLELFRRFEFMFERRLSEIPITEIIGEGKAENVAERHYLSLGYRVYRSRVVNGYRCLGVLDYWRKWSNRLQSKDREMLDLLKSSLSKEELDLLVGAVKDKVGTPDLLLFKSGKVSFVEVKANSETVKSC